MSATPPRLNSSLRARASMDIRSLVGSSSSCPSSFRPRELVQALDPLLDRVEVGQQAAQPAPVDERHAAASRPTPRPSRAPASWCRRRGPRRPCAAISATKSRASLEQLLRLQQVDDVDAVPLAVDVAAHAGVPAPRLVPEVDSGLEQLLDAYIGHPISPFAWSCRGLPSLRWGPGWRAAARARRRGSWIGPGLSVEALTVAKRSEPQASRAARQAASRSAGSAESKLHRARR